MTEASCSNIGSAPSLLVRLRDNLICDPVFQCGVAKIHDAHRLVELEGNAKDQARLLQRRSIPYIASRNTPGDLLPEALGRSAVFVSRRNGTTEWGDTPQTDTSIRDRQRSPISPIVGYIPPSLRVNPTNGREVKGHPGRLLLDKWMTTRHGPFSAF